MDGKTRLCGFLESGPSFVFCIETQLEPIFSNAAIKFSIWYDVVVSVNRHSSVRKKKRGK